MAHIFGPRVGAKDDSLPPSIYKVKLQLSPGARVNGLVHPPKDSITLTLMPAIGSIVSVLVKFVLFYTKYFTFVTAATDSLTIFAFLKEGSIVNLGCVCALT